MKILYIYPHPDDESFGPAPVMAKQRSRGHDVFLLTLTRGGATKQRFKYHYSIEEMGEVRFKEMQEVAKVLDLTGMTVLDLPDSGLKEMDPRQIEKVIINEIGNLNPNVIVTYAVHGISGFHDHLVCHAVVKRAFCESRNRQPDLKRLAFLTLTDALARQSRHFPLNGSTEDEIDCIVPVDAQDIKKGQQALDCYVTFRETIEKTGIREFIRHPAVFEFFQEDFSPPLQDLFAALPEN